MCDFRGPRMILDKKSPRPSGFLTTEGMFFDLLSGLAEAGPDLQWTRSCPKKIEDDTIE